MNVSKSSGLLTLAISALLLDSCQTFKSTSTIASIPSAHRTLALTKDGRRVNLSFSRLPSNGDMNALYPQKAQALRISGTVVLACDVASGGVLNNCSASDENPPAYGFAKAAIDLAAKFKISDPQIAHVEIPLRWQPPE